MITFFHCLPPLIINSENMSFGQNFTPKTCHPGQNFTSFGQQLRKHVVPVKIELFFNSENSETTVQKFSSC